MGYQNSLTQRIIPQSDDDYTTIYLPIISSDMDNSALRGSLSSEYCSPNSKIDIQVEATLGVNSTYCYQTAFNDGIEVDQPAAAYVTASDWSSTQTVTIGDYVIPTAKPTQSPLSSTITPMPTQIPTVTTTAQPQTNVNDSIDWMKVAIFVMALAVAALAAGMFLLWRRVDLKPVN